MSTLSAIESIFKGDDAYIKAFISRVVTFLQSQHTAGRLKVPEAPLFKGGLNDWFRRSNSSEYFGKNTSLWDTISPTIAVYPPYPELVEKDRTLM
jgi:hypothetical protein